MICSVDSCTSSARARGWCMKHYHCWRNYGDPLDVRNTYGLDIEDRLRIHGWDETMGPLDTPCWEWLPGGNYGLISVHGHNQPVHRISYELWVGPIPSGCFIRHKCDNPPCMNPYHLEPGTPKDNTHDMLIRDRTNTRVLTQQQAAQIRTDYLTGSFSYRTLGLVYGLPKATVAGIISGRRYKSALPLHDRIDT